MELKRRIVSVGGRGDGLRGDVSGTWFVAGSVSDGVVERYEIVRLRGSSRDFEVAVPVDKVLDGDWLIETLLAGYGRAR
jgi:hypothetical protein